MKQFTLFFKSFLFLFLFSISLSLHGQVYWQGGVGDWHDPSNWNTGQVPTANDLVIIKEGEVFILSGNDAFALSLITTADLLSIEANAGLVIANGFDGMGINNKGVINVDGTIRVSDILDFGAIGIYNNGEFFNQGEINSSGIIDGSGIVNENEIINEGDIIINNCGIWSFVNDGDLVNEGLIDIDNLNAGLHCSGISNIINRGEINIDCFSQGIFNFGRFSNAAGAIIRIFNQPGQGVGAFLNGKSALNPTPGSTENRGFIFTSGGGVNINVSNGNFKNYGKIEGFHSSLSAIKVGLSGTFKNYSQIRIYDGTGNGVSTTGLFVNRRFGNMTLWDFDQTHLEVHTQGEFRNFGSLSLDDSGQRNIENEGIFSNNGHGSLGLKNEVLTHTGSTFTNYGHIYSEFNGSHNINTNTFTNHGVLGDKTASFSNITNNGIHVLPIGPGVVVGQPTFNALGLGSLSGFSIGRWGAVLNWQSMGNYNSANNSFTPNSLAQGVTELVVEIRINSVNKTGYHRVPVIGGVQPSPSPFQNPVSGTTMSSGDIEVYPNPVQDNLTIKIPPSFETESWIIEIFSGNGQLMRREKYLDLTSLTIPVTDLPNEIYSLRITGGKNDVVRRFVKN